MHRGKTKKKSEPEYILMPINRVMVEKYGTPQKTVKPLKRVN